ncbi:MAG TPA: hypothetical protein VJ975_07490 [Candidatus Limnocylindria bacterium]|nr:hypothetical protein [Candidatus Limnocylindria bacterium]
MLRRLLRWLLGIPSPDGLEARRQLEADRDRSRTNAIREADRTNLGGPPGGGLGGSSGSFG